MPKYTVVGHVIGKSLPTTPTTIGGVTIKFLPNSNRKGGGPRPQHIEPGMPDTNYFSILPSHALVESDWQVGFQGVEASNEEQAVDLVHSDFLPLWKTAMLLSLDADMHVVLTGVIREPRGVDDGWSPWSTTAKFAYFRPVELRREQAELAASYARLLANDETGMRAAKSLQEAKRLEAHSGGVHGVLAAATLETMRCVEAVIQGCLKGEKKAGKLAHRSETIEFLKDLEESLRRRTNPAKRLAEFQRARSQLVIIEGNGSTERIRATARILELPERTTNEILGLWKYRSKYLAHPGERPPRIEEWASKGLTLAEGVLAAYVRRLRNKSG